MKVPITKPYLGKEEEQAAAMAIKSGWISQGPRVAEFEETMAAYVGAKHGIAVTSCTTALHLALLVVGIGPGDEVIVPSFSFIATANAVVHTGAKPVFVDIESDTYNIDSSKIEAAVTVYTKAVIPVHQIGLAADMDPILAITRAHNLVVIEDAAPSIGAVYKGKKVGSIGDMTCFSYHPRKAITTGEGGMITTDNDGYAAKAKLLRGQGMSVSDLERHQTDKVIHEKYPAVGYNYRMTDIQAAIGLEQMKRLDWIIGRRRELAARYNEMLQALPFIVPPYVPEYTEHTYQSFCVRVTDGCLKTRDEIMQKLLDEGIATRRGVMAIHLEEAYVDRAKGSVLPETEKATANTILLPLYPAMTFEEQNYVVNALRRCTGVSER